MEDSSTVAVIWRGSCPASSVAHRRSVERTLTRFAACVMAYHQNRLRLGTIATKRSAFHPLSAFPVIYRRCDSHSSRDCGRLRRESSFSFQFLSRVSKLSGLGLIAGVGIIFSHSVALSHGQRFAYTQLLVSELDAATDKNYVANTEDGGSDPPGGRTLHHENRVRRGAWQQGIGPQQA